MTALLKMREKRGVLGISSTTKDNTIDISVYKADERPGNAHKSRSLLMMSSCSTRISFTSRKELMAKMMDLSELTRYIKTDSLRSNAVRGLTSRIGLLKNESCLVCHGGIRSPKTSSLSS